MLAVGRGVVLPQGSSRIVLLAFTGPLVPRRGVATALAGEVDSGATIVAAHLLRVALHLPMDAPVLEGEARARELLGAVQARVAKAGVQAGTRIARGGWTPPTCTRALARRWSQAFVGDDRGGSGRDELDLLVLILGEILL